MGLVPDWPPPGVELDRSGAKLSGKLWDVPFEVDIGIDVLAVPSGLRGLHLTLADSNGRTWTEVHDLTVLTCHGAGCDDNERVMIELGLLTR